MNRTGSEQKSAVRAFWETAPCGTREVETTADERAYFAELERMRYAREPFIPDFARFASARGKRVLEVGVGAGTDFLRFVRSGAEAHGVDLTEAAVNMVKRRLDLEGLRADVRQCDAERLPFPDGFFDVVYSWGVIHHTPDTARAAREIVRVLAPGGRACVMLYHRRSLVALQAYLRFGLLRLETFRPIDEILAAHVESPGTKAYAVPEAAAFFSGLERVAVTPVVTVYDLRVGRRRFLPQWVRSLVPARLGWFLVVEGLKPASS
jgi:ubiquinone/menaquinone biosynthesis C-methylase UbiE